MKFVRAASARRASDDALVPLINIVFLLLIFFILAGTIAPAAALRLEPPTADSRNPMHNRSIVLALSEAGEIRLDGEPVALVVLGASLRKMFEQARTQAGQRIRLDLNADHRVPAHRLEPVLAAIRDAEIDDVYLRTRVRAQ